MKRKCHLIIVDFWLYSSPQISILAKEKNWAKLSIGHKLKKLIEEKSPIGKKIRKYTERGDLIPFHITQSFWEEALNEIESGDIYLPYITFANSDWKPFIELMIQNGFEFDYGWHIIKVNSDFSQEEKDAMNSWYKMGQDRHYEDVVNETKKANESIKERTSSFIKWHVVEVNTTK